MGTRTPANGSEFSISGANDTTGWIDYSDACADICFVITGTFVGTIALEVSDQEATTKTRYATVTSYTAVAGPLGLPTRIGRFFRFRFTAYTSGTAYVGLSTSVGSNGQIMLLGVQGTPNTPSGSF